MKNKRIIFGKDYLDKTVQFAESNKTLMFMVIVFLAVILLLIKAMISSETLVKIEFPKEVVIERDEPIRAGNNFGNDGFWRLWGVGTLEADWTNIEPNKIDRSVEYLYSLMDERTFVKKSDELESIKETVKANSLRLNFARKETQVKSINKGLGGVVLIKGISSLKIGADEPISKECSFEFEFEKSKGAIYVKDFNTDCFNIDNYRNSR